MPAQYRIVADNDFNVPVGQNQLFQFNLPVQVIRNGPLRPIISFAVKTNLNVGQMMFNVDINGQPQLPGDNALMGRDEKGVLWEVVNDDVVIPGNNSVRFRVVAGPVAMRFSDVVIWFQTP